MKPLPIEVKITDKQNRKTFTAELRITKEAEVTSTELLKGSEATKKLIISELITSIFHDLYRSIIADLHDAFMDDAREGIMSDNIPKVVKKIQSVLDLTKENVKLPPL